MRKILFLILLGMAAIGHAQTTIFNCTAFSSTPTATCGVAPIGGGGPNFALVGSGGTLANVSGSQVILQPGGNTHSVYSMNWQSSVNIQAFTSTFTFVPNGWNLSFVLQNNTNSNPNGNPASFFAGAGLESGIYQGFGTQPTGPDHIFAMVIDSANNYTGSTFGGSSVQIYQNKQPPPEPNVLGSANWWGTTKILTSPVWLTSPVTSANTTTGDTYSVTVTYDGTTFAVAMYDVTAGGSCPGVNCFTQSWSAVDIPQLVGANTATVGLSTSTNAPVSASNVIKSFSYVVNTPPSSPSLSTYTTKSNSGSTPAANPTFTPAAGSYSGAQSVALSSSTSGAYYCYETGTSIPAILPQPDNFGGCQTGTKYTGPISVASSETIYAITGTTYTGLPSATIAGAYTIGGTPIAAPVTFSPTAGNYSTSQTVTMATASPGALICYNTTGATFAINGGTICPTGSTLYTSPLTVNSTTTFYAKAGGVGFSDSTLSTAAYNLTVATPTFSPAAGTYTSTQTVTISDATPSAVIHYTVDGSTPTSGSPTYSAPITVSANTTVKAIAILSPLTNSAVGTAVYVIQLATPTFSPVAGSYTGTQTVTITFPASSTGCVGIGTTPTAPTAGTCGSGGTTYTGPITVSASETLNAISTRAGYTNSAVGSAAYTISSGPLSCATITIGATITGGVTLSCTP